MALIKVNTNHDPLVYHICVKTDSEQPIRAIAFDNKQPSTVFTDRKKNVNGTYDFYVRMPQCGNNTDIVVFNDKNGVQKDDKSFSIVKSGKLPMEKDILPIIDLTISQRSFLRFAQQFAYNAASLPVGSYCSDDNRFTIELYEDIIDDNGEVIPTSFRISTSDGTIQASKNMICNYTLPVIFFLLWHEYSHCYINKDLNNELEADLNALNIYLGLGYPYIDAVYALAITFDGNRTEENATRWEYCNKYIDDYYTEKSKYKD